ncbi:MULTISPECIES: (deoxy)nucleoside triphosphate pyrophosphohydrolase [Priestia]|uniref:(deoxy)nucleoside triphosphate pyrophosphohydrolase n=1 Tax=Priestia TaxID=2800373 RepID=UPI000BF98A13|nr:(deoxy)nucleoside triphosphate pyrophosphohydrolase [Priestia megaterium]MCM3154629.1 (deoxy)nucleoside triphosphate pyrophosphohydrolase [Priestia megaterium]MDC7767351.1 (deoxy)nucleoside triphosphate pyrophosphohydrolase [Priestia megaterium]PFQ86695.1 8-oxo-dGTP diphosphatase MutT [Priestia megaterium]PFW49092.1 8-oxo-dGTP diphosphatase MutT [Priestia megaterium]UYT83717.1 (deoxy)nucleoside triphosphate pyrophosphohydrolase [Priestia megaterium]
MKKKVKVVAAVIENEKEEVLCALRSNNMSLPNLWEFPGGKVEEGEDIYSALVREIEEELHCKVKTIDLHNEHVHEYETFIIELIAIKAEIIEGTPQPTEHAKLLWLNKENLFSLVWAPADIPAVELLVKEK